MPWSSAVPDCSAHATRPVASRTSREVDGRRGREGTEGEKRHLLLVPRRSAASGHVGPEARRRCGNSRRVQGHRHRPSRLSGLRTDARVGEARSTSFAFCAVLIHHIPRSQPGQHVHAWQWQRAEPDDVPSVVVGCVQKRVSRNLRSADDGRNSFRSFRRAGSGLPWRSVLVIRHDRRPERR